jgi:hypothetical protein
MTTAASGQDSEQLANELDAAFEAYRKRVSGPYPSYPVDAYTHFSAGFNAALRSHSERDALIEKAHAALVRAKEAIKAWHNMDGSSAGVWNIYDRNSPEMKCINEVIELTRSKGESR